MRTSLFLAAAATISIGLIASATGGPVTVPITFTPGTTAKAADVNGNFAAVATAVNGNAKDIATLKTTVQNIPAGPQGPVGPQGPQGAAGSGGVLVVDSNGATVGRWMGQSSVLMNINGHLVNVPLDEQTPLMAPQSGFNTQDVTGFAFWHITPDCSGTRYLTLNGSPGGVAGPYTQYQIHTVNNQATPLYLFYPASAPTQTTLLSYENFASGQNPLQPGTCIQLTPPIVLPVVVPAYFDVSTLGFVPPFSFK